MRAVLIRQQTRSRSPRGARLTTAAGIATLLGLALLTLSAPVANALSPAGPASIADRIAVAWIAQQQKGGAFKDPGSGRTSGGYANVMLGYSLLRAGERRHDERLVKAGVAAVTAGLYEPARFRGVFDELAVAASYDFARRRLAHDPAFSHARPAWENYLRGVGEPHTQGVLQACMANPKCFHNHEAAEDLADLQLLGTGLRSAVPAAKLSDRALLKRTVTAKIAGDLAESPGTNATTSWSGLGRPLGMLSDTGQWANAYHALSTAMLGGIVESLGPNATAQTRTALRTTTDTLDAFMAPDGDVTYLGRRQEQSWALAATVYAGEVAAGQLHDPKAAERYQGMADSALRRIERVHLHGRLVLDPVPRPLDTIVGYHGLDANVTVSSALTAFLLNRAADAAARAPRVHPAELPASRDGSFLQPDQAGFATVRHGDLWFAVHRRPITSDPRFDFGLMQAKVRQKDGGWRDLLRPRPLTHSKTVNSAGPVLITRSRRWVPWGQSIAVRPGGVVEVHGGWRYLRGASIGRWLRTGVTFRFTPLKDGVALTFPVKSGDNVRMQTYLPASSLRRGPNWVGDDRSTASLSTRPNEIRIGGGGSLASCCDTHLSAATMVVHAASDGDLTYSVVAGSQPGGPHAAPIATRVPSRSRGGGGGFPIVPAALLVAAALLLAAGLLRHRARVRRRERRRAERLERRGAAGRL